MDITIPVRYRGQLSIFPEQIVGRLLKRRAERGPQVLGADSSRQLKDRAEQIAGTNRWRETMAERMSVREGFVYIRHHPITRGIRKLVGGGEGRP